MLVADTDRLRSTAPTLLACQHTAEGPTRNGKRPLTKAPVDGHLGRGFVTMLLPYLPHQLYQGLNVSGLALGKEQASCSLWVIVAIILACSQH